jgi:hypothetical protein
MRAFIRRLRAAEDGILNHGRYPIGTSRLEGVNTKIKLLWAGQGTSYPPGSSEMSGWSMVLAVAGSLGVAGRVRAARRQEGGPSQVPK